MLGFLADLLVVLLFALDSHFWGQQYTPSLVALLCGTAMIKNEGKKLLISAAVFAFLLLVQANFPARRIYIILLVSTLVSHLMPLLYKDK